ncbi:MAG: TIGR03643 family protein [Pseudomonadota bacterium]
MTDAEISEIVELAWRDEVSFDDIAAQTGLRERDVIALMRRHLKPSSFRMWRKRVSGRRTKHASSVEKKRPE